MPGFSAVKSVIGNLQHEKMGLSFWFAGLPAGTVAKCHHCGQTRCFHFLPENRLAARKLVQTFRDIKKYKEFIKYMVSFLIYNDGIMMTMDYAAIIGAVLFGLGQQELIIFMIIVQVTSVAGAYLFGMMAHRWDSKRSLIFSVIMMIGVVIWLLFVDSLTIFYLLGALAGFALTGVQSVSRTMVGQFAPPGKAAEFFGFFEVGGRTSSFIGPTLYGVIAFEATKYFSNRGFEALRAEQDGMRVAIVSIAIFLAAGLAILLTVRQPKLHSTEDLKAE